MSLLHLDDALNVIDSCCPALYTLAMMDALSRDLRYSIRRLLVRPTYAIITVATLALVIGAATAVLAVVNVTLVRPLPFPDTDRLVQLF